MAAGTVSGVAKYYRRKNQKIGLIWIDAHTDINTPDTSPSGNVHGMPLAALMGLGPAELGNIYGFSPKVRPKIACSSAFATSTTLRRKTSAKPASRSSPCATSTNAACAP